MGVVSKNVQKRTKVPAFHVRHSFLGATECVVDARTSANGESSRVPALKTGCAVLSPKFISRGRSYTVASVNPETSANHQMTAST